MTNFCELRIVQDVPMVLHRIPTVSELVFLPDNVSVPCNESIQLDYIRAMTTPYGCVLEYPTYRTDEYIVTGVNGTLYFHEYPDDITYNVQDNNDLTVTLVYNTLPRSNTYPFVRSSSCFDLPPYHYVYNTKPSEIKETSINWQLPTVSCVFNKTTYKKNTPVLAVSDVKEIETLHYDHGTRVAGIVLGSIFWVLLLVLLCMHIISETTSTPILLRERSLPYTQSQNKRYRNRRQIWRDPGESLARFPGTWKEDPSWKE